MRLWPRRDPSPDRAALERAEAAEREVREMRAAFETLSRVVAESPALGTGTIQGARPLYAYDNPWNYHQQQTPKRRHDTFITLDDLRRVADTYDVLRACIQHLKREAAAVPIRVAAREEQDDAKVARRIRDAEAWFKNDGGCGGVGERRSHFEGKVIEDLCVVGAAAVYYQPARNGAPYQAIPIDAATIRPRVDAFGWPGPGEIVYEQWIEGRMVAGFTREQMRYDGLYPVSYTPYFKSPVEWLILAITSALKADEWNRAWLTDGNTPSDMLAVPDDWKPDDIKAYAEWFDSLLAGNSKQRQKMKFVPAGTSRVMTPTRKDQDFEAFELWLLRRTCSIMGVQPAAIGFAGEQYKVSQENSIEQTTQFGAGAILEFRKALYDDMLCRLGYDDLEVVNVTDQGEDAAARAERLTKACGAPYLTVNEARKEDGKEGIDGGDVLLVPATIMPLPDLVEQSSLTTAQSEQQLEQGEMALTPGAATNPEGEEGDAPGPPDGGTFPRGEGLERAGAAQDGHWVTVDDKPVFIPAGKAGGAGPAGHAPHAHRKKAQAAIAAKHGAVAAALGNGDAAAFQKLKEQHAPKPEKLSGLAEKAKAEAKTAGAMHGPRAQEMAGNLKTALDTLHQQAEAAHAKGDHATASALLQGAKNLHASHHYWNTLHETLAAKAQEEADAQSGKPKTLQLADLKQVGPKPGGSVPGAMYEDAEGNQWLVKHVQSRDHAKNEVLAAALAKAAGLEVPELALVQHGDKLSVGSKWVEGLKDVSHALSTGTHEEAAKGFAANAWLANWDAAGLAYDNIMETPDGKAMHVDMGGALEYRAQGGKKGAAFGTEVTELKTLKDPDKNLQAANLYKNVTPADLAKQAQALPDDETIKKLVAAHEVSPDLAEKLVARKAHLLGQVGAQAQEHLEKKHQELITPEPATLAQQEHHAKKAADYHQGDPQQQVADSQEKAAKWQQWHTEHAAQAKAALEAGDHEAAQTLGKAAQLAASHAHYHTHLAQHLEAKAAGSKAEEGKADAPSEKPTAKLDPNAHLAAVPPVLQKHAELKEKDVANAQNWGAALFEENDTFTPEEAAEKVKNSLKLAHEYAQLSKQHDAKGETDDAIANAQSAKQMAKQAVKWTHYASLLAQKEVPSPSAPAPSESPAASPDRVPGLAFPKASGTGQYTLPEHLTPHAAPKKQDVVARAQQGHADLGAGKLTKAQAQAGYDEAKKAAQNAIRKAAKIHQGKLAGGPKAAESWAKKAAQHRLEMAYYHGALHGAPKAGAPSGASSPTPPHAVLQAKGPKGVPHIDAKKLYSHKPEGVANLYSNTGTTHNNYFKSKYADVTAGYSNHELVHISAYTGSSFSMNQALRQNKGDVPATWKDRVEALDAAAEKSKIKEPVVIWRGEGLSVDPTTWVGSTFTHHEFGSWSTSTQKPQEFAAGGQYKILRRVTLQPGHKAIITLHGETGYDTERELILARGTTMRTTHVETAEVNGMLHYIVHQEIVAQK